MLTSNTKAILITSTWFTDSAVVFGLAPIIQEWKRDVRPAYSYYATSLDASAPRSSS